MDKTSNIDSGYNHSLSIAERKSIVLTGVKKIESFDSEEFLMETTMGYLAIKGSELEIIKLDTYQGNVSIKGRIDSLMYLDNVKVKRIKMILFWISYLNDIKNSNIFFVIFFLLWNICVFFIRT